MKCRIFAMLLSIVDAKLHIRAIIGCRIRRDCLGTTGDDIKKKERKNRQRAILEALKFAIDNTSLRSSKERDTRLDRRFRSYPHCEMHRIAGMQLHELSDNYANRAHLSLSAEIYVWLARIAFLDSRDAAISCSSFHLFLVASSPSASISLSPRFFFFRFFFFRTATFGAFSWRRRTIRGTKRGASPKGRWTTEAEGLARSSFLVAGQWNDSYSATHRGRLSQITFWWLWDAKRRSFPRRAL